MGDKREAAAAVPVATAAPVFKELEPARKRRRRRRPAGCGPTVQTLTLAAPDFLCCETEPVGYLKVAHILPFLKDGLKVRLFVAKIDVYVVDEGFFFVGIGILVPKLGEAEEPSDVVKLVVLAEGKADEDVLGRKIPEDITEFPGNEELTTFSGLEGRVIFWPKALLSLLRSASAR